MTHPIIPAKYQRNPGVDRNDPEGAKSATELQFPPTFNQQAWRVIRYMEGAMFLYSYKGKLVVTDESLYLTDHGNGTHEAPYGGPRWVGDSLEDLEQFLTALSKEYDADDTIPGWEARHEEQHFD